MQLVLIIVIMGITFGLCYLADKGFTKIFRSKQQHKSGLSVRLSKRYGSMGLILATLGLAAVFSGLQRNAVVLAGGCVVLVTGISLVVYYMTFGVFYDDEGFVLTTFGKKSNSYAYRDIQAQQLYNNSGTILVELHLSDGRAMHLQSGMEGVYPFLDKAFTQWLAQTGRTVEDCPFYDPANSCWFPPVEG